MSDVIIPLESGTDVIIPLESGTVVDRSKLEALSNIEVESVMVKLYSKPLPARVVFVNDAAIFFSLSSILKALEVNDPNLDLLLEYNSITLSSEDFLAVARAIKIKEHISTVVAEKIKAALPAYVFADIPEGWSIDRNIKITTNLIKRYNGEYSIGIKTCQNLWNYAAPYWAGHVNLNHLGYYSVRASTYNKEAQVDENRIKLGCQSINRFELEQLALKLGWAFPNAPVEITESTE